LLLV
jgi:hypothetical protein